MCDPFACSTGTDEHNIKVGRHGDLGLLSRPWNGAGVAIGYEHVLCPGRALGDRRTVVAAPGGHLASLEGRPRRHAARLPPDWCQLPTRRRLRRPDRRRAGDHAAESPAAETPGQAARGQALRHPRCRRGLTRRRVKVQIARKGAESSERPGRHRWVAERTLVRLAQMPPAGHPLRTARGHPRRLRLPRLSAHRLQDPHSVLTGVPKAGWDRLRGVSDGGTPGVTRTRDLLLRRQVGLFGHLLA
jgi:hypothetical protein